MGLGRVLLWKFSARVLHEATKISPWGAHELNVAETIFEVLEMASPVMLIHDVRSSSGMVVDPRLGRAGNGGTVRLFIGDRLLANGLRSGASSNTLAGLSDGIMLASHLSTADGVLEFGECCCFCRCCRSCIFGCFSDSARDG